MRFFTLVAACKITWEETDIHLVLKGSLSSSMKMTIFMHEELQQVVHEKNGGHSGRCIVLCLWFFKLDQHL